MKWIFHLCIYLFLTSYVITLSENPTEMVKHTQTIRRQRVKGLKVVKLLKGLLLPD